MKIKEVCRATGLTEKAVRYYVENGLCSPRENEQRGRRYLDFSERNVSELKNIGVMRRLGFSVEDIRRMKEDSRSIDRVMRGYIRSLSEELEVKRRVFTALAYRDYTGFTDLEELMPALSQAMRPDPAEPDFKKFEDSPFDDGAEEQEETGGFGLGVRLQEMFISYAAVLGTLVALTTVPGAVMCLIAILFCRRGRSNYVLLYKVMTAIGVIANTLAFVRCAESIGWLERLGEITGNTVLGYAAIQCAGYLTAALAEFIAFMILTFGRNIKEYFNSQR